MEIKRYKSSIKIRIKILLQIKTVGAAAVDV